jgi:hypothetical protein
MTPARKYHQPGFPDAPQYVAADPLYKRAPRVDEHGKPLSDFMMIIPKLRMRPHHALQEIIAKIKSVLEQYADTVVFVDLNLRLNVLWVLVRPVPGICRDLPSAISNAVPEALLVAQPPL